MSHVSASVSPESGIDRFIFSAQVGLRRSKQHKTITGIIPVARHGPRRNLWTPAGVRSKGTTMKNSARRRGLLLPLIAITATITGSGISRAQTNDATDLSIELVDPKVLRVCADPRNLPFSNDKGEGFENRLGELFAEKLQKKLDYTYFPQAAGFVRMTLAAHRCDVIMGFPQGGDLVQGTNPYYRTAYALVARQGSGLDEVATLGDQRLKGKHIGIVAGTPPATNMAVNGLMADARSYPLMIDTRLDSSAEAMINDLTSGKIDAAILWGPMAGFYAGKASPPLHVTPLVKETAGPKLAYRIGMGVRPADQNWKRQLNRLIQENQPAINKILLDFGVPLLDENDRPIGAETAKKSP
jgi:quinoprotein dehydrogenase-associated probable ABC transporter substrate-binding protein